MKLVANARVRFNIVNYLKSLRLVFYPIFQPRLSVSWNFQLENGAVEENINSF